LARVSASVGVVGSWALSSLLIFMLTREFS
jgi:hypothetical protein